jgi:putative transposase
VSLLCVDVIPAAPAARAAVGVDAGLATMLTLSTAEKIANPRHERADRTRLARAHRALSRKEKGSNNRSKARLKVARAYARITDRRRDYLHKVTTRLVRENQTIVIEDLSVRNMVKNRALARSISDAAWRQFRTMLKYKAVWYGRHVISVDRWFPSSKLCSVCGALSVAACGADVRPQRESSRTRLSAVKQEIPGATHGIPLQVGEMSTLYRS